MFTDIFNNDAFSLVSLTAAINNVDQIPGRAGELVFAGVGEGVPTTFVAIESKASAITLIPTSVRGAPSPKETQDKADVRNLTIPHIKLEDTIRADQVMNVREFGTTDQLRSVQAVVNRQLVKMAGRHDMTLENLRLGALKGQIIDADGSTVILDLFSAFGVSQQTFDMGLNETSSAGTQDIRVIAQQITRFIARNAKTPIPSTAKYWAFCGDNFFDKLIARADVKAAFINTSEQIARLGSNYAFSAFEFGGIVWENYRGSDDASTVTIPTNEARCFLTGVPGLYAEYFAPADFAETVNTNGLPRYAKAAPDNRFNQFVEVHTQQNPLPLCLRPRTIVKLTV